MKLFVNYTVGDENFQCGPYDESEADWQRDDVASYEGVSNVYLTPHRDEKRRWIHADFTAPKESK